MSFFELLKGNSLPGVPMSICSTVLTAVALCLVGSKHAIKHTCKPPVLHQGAASTDTGKVAPMGMGEGGEEVGIGCLWGGGWNENRLGPGGIGRAGLHCMLILLACLALNWVSHFCTS